MTEYVFSIVVRDLSEEQAFDVFELEGSLGGGAVAGVAYVEFELETDMPEAAVDAAVHGLKAMGIEPIRVDVDAVGIAGVAERTGASRQAVRMWVEGERREGFPAPYSYSNGLRTWRWADVFAWLIEKQIAVEGEYSVTPVPAQVADCYNGHLADPTGPYASPADKRSATAEIPTFDVRLLHTLGIERRTTPTHWSTAVSNNSAPIRLDRRAQHPALTPSDEWSAA